MNVTKIIVMEKPVIYTILFLINALLSNAQIQYPFVYDNLTVNNWSVLISASNSNFWNMNTGSSRAEIPQGSGNHSIFSTNIWLGGIDDSLNLHVSVDRYSALGGCLTPGPFATNYDSSFYVKYNRVWKIDKDTIEYHINHWNDIGYTIPDVIETWPGNGNIANGEAPVLAPYVDVNGNSIYDPINGDYPIIYGDMAIYFILNDDNSNDTLINPMGLEIRVMAFAYQDTGVINNTFFMHYDIINKSQYNYNDVYCGINTDIDIGNAFDDYIGCDSTQNYYFGYNGDEDDENNYGLFPPALGVMFLNHPMSSFMYFISGAGAMGDPTTSIGYYNYMQSYWRDGSHLQYGGTGHLSGGYNTNYTFPLYSGWSEETEGNVPDDRRGIGAIHIGNLNSNACITADIAYFWSRDTVNNDRSLGLLISQAPLVKQYYDQLNIDTSCNYLSLYNDIHNPYTAVDYFNVFPNPTNNYFYIRTNLTDYTIFIYSELGQKIWTQKNAKQININNLQSGIYFVNITSGTKTAWRKLIVK